jgi:hypothetical protein
MQIQKRMRDGNIMDKNPIPLQCCILEQRFPNCGPRTTGGPRVLPLWSSYMEH